MVMTKVLKDKRLMIPFFINFDDPDSPRLGWVNSRKLNDNAPFLTDDIFNFALNENRDLAHSKLSDLFFMEEDIESIPPSGFIFHMSRCGSTLLNNMLKQSDKNIAVSEPEVLFQLLHVASEETAPYILELFKKAVYHLGKKRKEANEHFIIKFSSASTVFMEYVIRAFPNVPRVFIYRDPAEVLVSNLKNPNQEWVTMERVLGITAEEMIQQNTLLENFALGLKRTCEGFANHFDKQSMAFNYNQLSGQLFERILEFFKIYPEPEELEKMLSEMQYYSKNRNAKFASDVRKKQAKASPAVRQMAAQHLQEVYDKLESLRTELVQEEITI